MARESTGQKSSRQGEYGHGLKRFEADIHGFEPLLTQALIQSGPTLQSLYFSIHRSVGHGSGGGGNDEGDEDFDHQVIRSDLERDQVELHRILQACPQLRRVQLLYDETLLSDPTLFKVDPQWMSIVNVEIADVEYHQYAEWKKKNEKKKKN